MKKTINAVTFELAEGNYSKVLELLNNARDNGAECSESACDSCKLVKLSQDMQIPPAEFASYPTCNELINYLSNLV